ncbi:uncharacterized protein LOC119727354 [Patiria miniata]|uniref:Uncharacterized protein n=1 Tax=Patiria miniata TaxID=46514 RepID=A0A913ZTS3_PATMI|nr:uncharacterized protein LOC119727354 [Patiria miniata]
MSLTAAHRMFQKEYPDSRVSYSKFTFLRPKNVRLLSKVHHEVCTCVYCMNIKYKLMVVNRVINTTKSTSGVVKIADEYEFVNKLLCPVSDSQRFQNEECVFGTCDKCGNLGDTIRKMYEPVIKEARGTWNWLHWERVEVIEGKPRRVLKTKQGSMGDVLEELINDAERPVQGVSFVKHIVTARWQHRQYSNLKEHLPENWAMMVMDFGQNRKVFYQDEIKAAYYGQMQITMHPVVMYYRQNGTLVRDSMIFLSDDIRHDYHAVEHYLNMASQHLASNMQQVDKEVLWSDGCQSQYKGKGTFADLSLSSDARERNYFGSEHGKGEGDGEIGVVNRAVDQAILGRKVVINSAKDMWGWCCANLASDSMYSKRSFVYVAKDEISRERPETDVTTLKGSRGYHQIQVAAPYKLKVRRLSCFCFPCLLNNNEMCTNATYTGGKFEIKQLSLKAIRNVHARNRKGVSKAATELNDASVGSEPESVNEPQSAPIRQSSRSASPVPPPSDPASIRPNAIECGHFVAVKLHGKRGTSDWYLAKVMDVTETAMCLSYLSKSGSYYVWPDNEDTSWQNRCDYLCHVDPQWTVIGSRIKMTLTSEDRNRCINTFNVSNQLLVKMPYNATHHCCQFANLQNSCDDLTRFPLQT